MYVRVCTCCLRACARVCARVKERERREERERRTKSGKKSVWRLLHVNCTSSGALVDSIPGTCWSAIHMTVPCCLIIPPASETTRFPATGKPSPWESVSRTRMYRGASVANACNFNRARFRFLPHATNLRHARPCNIKIRFVQV